MTNVAKPPVVIDVPVEEAAKELLRRRHARSGVLDFTEYTYPMWRTSAHHKKICDHLDALARGDIRKLMIHAPPRHSKSELASRRFPAWYLGHHPDQQIIVVSHTDSFASDLSRNIMDICKSPEYKALFPKMKLHPDLSAACRWCTTEGGILISAGVHSGQITGRGYHLAILDDIYSGREAAESEAERNNILSWYHGTFRTRQMDDSRVLLMMTRWHTEDLAGQLLDTEGAKWTVLNLPAIEHEATDHEEALWPDRYSVEFLQEQREGMISAGFLRDWNSQYQQQPTAFEGDFCKRVWFEDRYEQLPSSYHVYMASDFAVSKPKAGQDPDYTEHGVFAVGPDDKLYVLDWWTGRTTADVFIDSLIDLALKWKPMRWFGESGPIASAIKPFLLRRMRERRAYFYIEWLKATKDKSIRARPLQAWSSMRRIVFPKRQAWAERVIENVVGFPSLKHDDKFDVMAMICLGMEESIPASIKKDLDKPRIDRYSKIRRRVSKDWMVI
jgi:predicted phage terminase large subunit-like protein